MESLKLKSVANVLTGFSFKGNEYTDQGIRVIRGENVTEGKLRWDSIKCWNQAFDKFNDYSLKADDIVIGMDGSKVGKNKARIFENNLPLLLAQRVARVRANKGTDQIFLYYCISNKIFENYIYRIQTGSSVPHISKSQIEDYSIPAFDFHLQVKISKTLSDLDKKIEVNNKINTELDNMSRLLYNYWFVQFDFPDANGKPYKSSGGKMIYSETLKREIPDGWDVNSLSDWIKTDKTGDWGKEVEQGNYTLGVDCVRGADINGMNGRGKVKTPHRFILQKNRHKLLDPFDLVVEISGGSPTQSTGRMTHLTLGTFDRFESPLICSNFCKAISLANNNYFFNFVYQWNAIYDNDILFGWEGKTSGIKNLLFDSFVSKHNVCMPPEILAKRFYDFIEPLERKKQNALNENSKLESLREWLLPMLMNGQVTFKESA
jgi:type I restriction enzyme, S subunit